MTDAMLCLMTRKISVPLLENSVAPRFETSNLFAIAAIKDGKDGGYDVTAGPGQDAFLIDLVAKISCPVCDRPVRVAVCCGAHTYRPHQEIAGFHRATSTDYNARVYVSPSQPTIVNCCHEFGVQLIDPDPEIEIENSEPDSLIPLLKGIVTDHERASVESTENK